MKRSSGTFYRFFASYFIRILAVCFSLFICFGIFSFYQEKKEREEAVQLSLDYSLNYLNSFFEGIARNTQTLVWDSAVSGVMHSPFTVDHYDYVLTMRQCEEVLSQATALGCRSVYLYHEQSGIVFATGTGKLDVNDFRDGTFLLDLGTCVTPAILSRQLDGSDVATLVLRYSSGYSGRNSGYICFNLNTEYLQRQLSLQLGEGYTLWLETPGMETDRLVLGDAAAQGYSAQKQLNTYNLKATLIFSKDVFWERFLRDYLKGGGLLFLLALVITVIFAFAVQSLQEVFRPVFQKLEVIYQQDELTRSPTMEEFRRNFDRLISDREQYSKQLQEARKTMENSSLRSVLLGTARAEELAGLLPAIDTAGEDDAFLVACIRLSMENKSDKDRILSKTLVLSVFSEDDLYGCEPATTSMDRETIAVFLRYRVGMENAVRSSFMQKAEHIRQSLPESLAKDLFISVVFPIVGTGQIHEAYQLATANLLYQDILVNDCCTFSEMSGPELSVLVPKADLDRLTFAVDIDRIELVERYLRQMLFEYVGDSDEEWYRLKSKVLVVIGAILNQSFSTFMPSLWHRLYDCTQKVLDARTQEELVQEMRSLMGAISQERLSIVAESDSGSRYVRAACRYIEEHFEHRISIPDIARSLSVNDKYLSRLFKQKRGQTILQYISKLRLDRAVYLLRETDLPVNEIGMRIGFEDVRGFLRLFKKEYGMTPSEYRLDMGVPEEERARP